jgi:hypothetical protein
METSTERWAKYRAPQKQVFLQVPLGLADQPAFLLTAAKPFSLQGI